MTLQRTKHRDANREREAQKRAEHDRVRNIVRPKATDEQAGDDATAAKHPA
jgi:hypothetical protein